MQRTYYHRTEGVDKHRKWSYQERIIPLAGHEETAVIVIQHRLLPSANGDYRAWVLIPGMYLKSERVNGASRIDPVPDELRKDVEEMVRRQGLEGKVLYWD